MPCFVTNDRLSHNKPIRIIWDEIKLVINGIQKGKQQNKDSFTFRKALFKIGI